MADTAIAITAGTGTNVDTRTEGTNGNHRQVVVLGDPATNAGVAPVDVTSGLKVNLGADNDVTVTSGTVAATQSGTWTVQPGNTANTTAWKVDASSVAVPITDNSGSLTVDGSVTANAGTNLNTANIESYTSRLLSGSVPAGGGAATATTGQAVGGTYNSTPITLTNTQQSAVQLDSNGFLKVNVAAGGASGGTSSTFGAAAPATGTAVGATDGTNMQPLTVDASGFLKVNVAAGGGSGGTSSTVGAAVPGTGTAVGLSDGTNMRVPRAFDADTGAGTEYVTGFVERVAASGGSTAKTFGAGATDAGTQRIALASDSAGVITTGTAGTAASDVVTIQGIASMTAVKVDGSAVTQPVSIASVPSHAVTNAGTFATQAAQSGTWTVQPGNTANTTAWKVDGSAVTQPVSLASVPSHAVTNAGTFAVQAAAAGDVASGASDSGNPVKVGVVAHSSEPTAVTTGQRVNLMADLVGKLITLPYANPENFVSGAITTAMTATTSTSLIAAPGAGLRNYITTIVASNSHATVGTDVAIQDGSGGTTLMTIPAAALYGGSVINLPVPLRQPTANTALYCVNVTTGASTKVSAVGYKGA